MVQIPGWQSAQLVLPQTHTAPLTQRMTHAPSHWAKVHLSETLSVCYCDMDFLHKIKVIMYLYLVLKPYYRMRNNGINALNGFQRRRWWWLILYQKKKNHHRRKYQKTKTPSDIHPSTALTADITKWVVGRRWVAVDGSASFQQEKSYPNDPSWQNAPSGERARRETGEELGATWMEPWMTHSQSPVFQRQHVCLWLSTRRFMQPCLLIRQTSFWFDCDFCESLGLNFPAMFQSSTLIDWITWKICILLSYSISEHEQRRGRLRWQERHHWLQRGLGW